MIRIYDKNQFHKISAEIYSGLAAQYQSDSFSPENLLKDRPDVHIIRTDEDRADAWCSVWWEGTPDSCGTVGHFFAVSKTAGLEVLRTAETLLKSQNCKSILAPMNGNTWRSYRYATGGRDEPSFLMEPPSEGGREEILHCAGFAPCNWYLSYITALDQKDPLEDAASDNVTSDDIGSDGSAVFVDDPISNANAVVANNTTTDAHSTVQRLSNHSITVKTLDPQQFEASLEQVYSLSLRAFNRNPFYTDLPQDVFLSQYVPYRRLLIPDLILMAWQENKLVGFLFCIPDYAESSNKPTTLLFKTIAVDPDCQNLGIAGVLVETAKEKAAELGFTRAIGALIHETNHSGGFFRNAEVFRRYTLYKKTL